MRTLRTSASIWLVVCAVISGGLALGSNVASAFVTRNLLGSFGPGGPGVGSFSNVQGVAVDQGSGTVYVFDSATRAIYKFNSAGEPREFSALKADAIESVGGAGRDENEIAVDSSTGPAKGDIYLANGSHVGIYDPSGTSLGELNSEVTNLGAPWGEPCGVAVDPSGSVYVGLYGYHVNKYTPTANPVTNADYKSSLAEVHEVCNVAADAEGKVYVDTWPRGPVRRYPPSQFGQPRAQGTQVSGAGSTLAVEPLTNDLYDDTSEGITQFNSSGQFLLGFASGSEPGALSDSFGIAIYNPTRPMTNVYVAGGASGQVEIYAPGVVIPDVATGQASSTGVFATTAEGTVNPDNTTLTSCQVEYGTSTSYGSVASCASIPPPGENPVSVTANLTGLLPGTVYHYRLSAGNANGTGTGADQTFRTPAAVEDEPASNVTQFAAILNATVNPGPIPASYHFGYGTTSAYGSTAPIPDRFAAPGYLENKISQIISGLQPGTTYHYALVAADVAGTITGTDQTFTTPSVPAPEASTGSSNEISRSSAVVNGTVDPHGWDTSYQFQYGTSTAYGHSWPTVPAVMGAFTGSQPVTIELQQLQPNATYHYRLIATNSGGTSYGTDQRFTTSEYPQSVIQESSVSTANFGFVNPEAKTGKSTSKSLARAQKLTNALKTCKRRPKKQRGQCERQARARYGPMSKKKK
jgi:hypothetical protein